MAITASRFHLQQPAHMKAILLTFIAPPGDWSPETTAEIAGITNGKARS